MKRRYVWLLKRRKLVNQSLVFVGSIRASYKPFCITCTHQLCTNAYGQLGNSVRTLLTTIVQHTRHHTITRTTYVRVTYNIVTNTS